jgi:hypothetical protein
LDNIVLDKKDFLESNDGIATLLSTPKKKALDVFVKAQNNRLMLF